MYDRWLSHRDAWSNPFTFQITEAKFTQSRIRGNLGDYGGIVYIHVDKRYNFITCNQPHEQNLFPAILSIWTVCVVQPHYERLFKERSSKRWSRCYKDRAEHFFSAYLFRISGRPVMISNLSGLKLTLFHQILGSWEKKHEINLKKHVLILNSSAVNLPWESKTIKIIVSWNCRL